ncbi:arylsulfatase [Rhodopirellula sp. JC737]|nr:arylsulfatase [Rhodopirellula sp. JC737]
MPSPIFCLAWKPFRVLSPIQPERMVGLLACMALILSSVVVSNPLNAQETTPPNIVLIVADDLGYGELGCYGQEKIRTPRLDQLAAEGIKLTNFYSGNAVCAPSRCCLMTGKHPGHAHVRDNGDPKIDPAIREELQLEFPGQFPLPTDEVTIAEYLKSAGYRTGAFGKWGLGHFGTTGDPNSQGFDLFYGFNCQRHAHNHYPKFLWRNRVKEVQPGNDRTLHGETYSQDQFVDEACAFIRQSVSDDPSKPFFAYLPFAVPHLSIQVPNEDLNAYDGVIEEEEYTHRGYLEHPRPRAGYAAMVTRMDTGIGQVVDLIDSLGLGENTLILFTSDNGPTYNRLGGSDSDYFESADGLKGLKGQLDEGGIRVPLIARQTGVVPAGRTSDWVGAWWDFLPTLADAAGVEVDPATIDGISFLPLLQGESNQPTHDFLYWESPGYSGQQAIRMGQWKAIRKGLARRPKKNTTGPPAFALYDLANDRAETTDVSQQHPDVMNRILAIAEQQHVPSEQFPLRAID